MIRRTTIASLRVLLVLTVILGVIYPLAVTGGAQVVFPSRANGSLVEQAGRVVGSSLLGQSFTGPEWFHGRPDADDPSASGPSNLGPSNPALGHAVRSSFDRVIRDDPNGETGSIPVDAVTSSGSGLDPDISPAYARLQAPRVARARGFDLDTVIGLIEENTTDRTFGFLGEPRVNVLGLNLAVERLASTS